MVATLVFIIRDTAGYHNGTVIKLYHEDGEPFDPKLAKAIRELDLVQDATLETKSCLVTMAKPARNDDDGAITAVIEAVAEVLNSEYERRPLTIEDDPHLSLLRAYDYRPPKKARKVPTGD